MVKCLITGAAGFIGHHVVEYLLERSEWHVTVIDRLDVSGNLNRLAEVGAAKNPRVRFVYHDLRAPIGDQLARQLGEFEHILHLAAATHVDRSIQAPLDFVYDNVVGTCNLLDFARQSGCGRFVYFSTDEVFGPAPDSVRYREWDRYRSGNPYAATKAGGEELALAYHNTYGLPTIITHTMNVIGRRQHPEKFVPMTIGKVDRGETVLIHSDPTRTVSGSRYYIDARDVADGLSFVVANGEAGEKYNIVGASEVSNLEMAQMVAASVGKPLHYEMIDFHSQRPGHDLRYALDGSLLASMGWSPSPIFGRVNDLVRWTLDNRHWMLAA